MNKPKITDAQIAAAQQAVRDSRWASSWNRTPDPEQMRSILRAALETK